MPSSAWINYRDEVKSLNSCVDFLHSYGLNVSRPGQSIVCPSFIRPGSDSPSFSVYENNAFDWVTQQSYDVIDLCALAMFNGDKTPALEYLAGRKLPFNTAKEHDVRASTQQQKFSERVAFWHSELLKNPKVMPFGSAKIEIPIFDYLAQRGFSRNDIDSFKLGFSHKQGRLMIPFFNRRGDPVYVVGRAMFPTDKAVNCPKYLYMKLNDENFYEILDKCIFGIDSVKPGRFDYDTVFDAEQGQLVKLSTYPIERAYLAVTEGIFDVLSFRSQDWDAVTGKISQKQEREFLDICRLYKEKGKKIFVCFDSDKAGQHYQQNIVNLLFRNGIPFVAGHLPKTFVVSRAEHPDFGKEIPIKDVSDYYAAGGSLAELVKSARPGLQEIAFNCKTDDDLAQVFLESGRCCDRTQRQFLKKYALSVYDEEEESIEDINGETITNTVRRARFDAKYVGFLYAESMRPLQDCDIAKFVEGKHKLIYDTLGQFYEYRNGVWRAMNDLLVEQEIMRIMNGHITAAKVTGVLKYLQVDLAANIQFNTKHNFVFKNGTLWLDEEPKTRDAMSCLDIYSPYMDPKSPLCGMPSNFKKSTPEDMSTLQVSYNFDPKARNEVLEQAVREWTNHKDGSPDPDKYRLVQQMFGYILFVKNTLQKFFILKGDGSNGKSTCMHCIEAILGRENTTSLQISRLSSEFDPMVLKHSRVNLCYDAQTSIEAAQETLKAIIGGDQITAAHKGVDAESFTTNAKFIVSANKFFSANDLSRGLLRRMLFIAFNNTFEPVAGGESIEDKIMEDLPGLFNFAYEGYKDLKASGYFVETEEQAALLEEFREQLSPLMLFAREELYHLNGGEITGKTIYSMYSEWCKENGEKALGRTKFIPEIRQVIRTDGNIIPDPYRDKDTKQWIFVFPYKPIDEQDEQKEVLEDKYGEDVQEVCKSNEQEESTQSEESAHVHSGTVCAEQAGQEERSGKEAAGESRKSSEALQKVEPAAKKADTQTPAKTEEPYRPAILFNDESFRMKVPEVLQCKWLTPEEKKEQDKRIERCEAVHYNEDHGRSLFFHLKKFGRDWRSYLDGTYICREHGADLEYDISKLPITNADFMSMIVYLKKKPELRVFLPGIEEIVDFEEDH